MAQFVYRKPSNETIKSRATQKGGSYDSYLKQEFETFSPKEGDLTIRLLPNTSPDLSHYGMDVWVHSGIGPNEDSYLCKEKMQHKRCILCEEHARAAKEGDEKYANELKPYKRVLVWMVDRDEEKAGPQLYAMPWTLDKEFTARSIDKKTHEVIYIDHPDEGFDLEFRREGKGLKTKYVAINIARRSSCLHEDLKLQDKWLDFVTENPLPSALQFYEDDYLQKVFDGGARPEGGARAEGGDANPRTRHREEAAPARRSAETETDAPRRSSREEPEPARRREADPEPAAPRRREIDDASASLDDAPRRRPAETETDAPRRREADPEPAAPRRREEPAAEPARRSREPEPEPARRSREPDPEPRRSREADPEPRRREADPEPPAKSHDADPEPRRREAATTETRRREPEPEPRRRDEPAAEAPAPRRRVVVEDDVEPRRREADPEPRKTTEPDAPRRRRD